MKRSQHLKHKKNFTKPLKKKDATNAAAKTSQKATSDKTLLTTKKVFGKSPGAKAKHKQNKYQKNKQNHTEQKEVVQNGHAKEVDDNDNVDDILDMIDEEDRELFDGLSTHTKKRKRNDGDDEVNQAAKRFEKQHATSAQAEANKRTRTVDLLPIKTKHGEIITRSTEVKIPDKDENGDEGMDDDDDEEAEVADSDDDIVHDEEVNVRFVFLFWNFLLSFFFSSVNNLSKHLKMRFQLPIF